MSSLYLVSTRDVFHNIGRAQAANDRNESAALQRDPPGSANFHLATAGRGPETEPHILQEFHRV